MDSCLIGTHTTSSYINVPTFVKISTLIKERFHIHLRNNCTIHQVQKKTHKIENGNGKCVKETTTQFKSRKQAMATNGSSTRRKKSRSQKGVFSWAKNQKCASLEIFNVKMFLILVTRTNSGISLTNNITQKSSYKKPHSKWVCCIHACPDLNAE